MLKKLFYTVLLIVAFVSLFSFYAYGEISQSSNDFKSQGFAGNVCNTSGTTPLMLSKTVNCITTLGNGFKTFRRSAHTIFPQLSLHCEEY